MKNYKVKLISTHAAAGTLVNATKAFSFSFQFYKKLLQIGFPLPLPVFSLCLNSIFTTQSPFCVFALSCFPPPSLHPGPAVDSRWCRPGYSWLSGPRSCCAVLYISSTCCALMALTLSLIATPSWLCLTLLCPSPCLLLLLLAPFCILNIIFLVTTTHWLQAAKVSIGRFCCFCTQCICAAWKQCLFCTLFKDTDKKKPESWPMPGF